MRKFIVTAVLFLAVIVVIFSLTELQNVVATLKRSNIWFLLAAFLIEVIWLFNSATDYSSLYRVVGLQEKNYHLVLVATAANFVNVIAPSVGIGGMAVFLDDARKRNHSIGKVTVVGVLYILFDYAAFFCVLALAFIVLIRRNNLNAGEITSAIILLGIATGVAFLLYLGYKSADRLGKTLAWLARQVNRILKPFLHRDYLQEEKAHFFAHEAAEGIYMLRGRQKLLIWPMLYALNNFALLICVLAFTFLALGTPFSIGTLIGGFAIAYLFLIVSPTPSGLGVVEGTMTAALNTLRVELAAAVLITLTYRLITFWFPLAVGAVAFRLLGGRSVKMPAPDKEDSPSTEDMGNV